MSYGHYNQQQRYPPQQQQQQQYGQQQAYQQGGYQQQAGHGGYGNNAYNNGYGGSNSGYGQHQQQQQPQINTYGQWYANQLQQLTFNSRPHIQHLSVEALKQRDQNNWDNMQAISDEIEQAVFRVRI
jgi:hypothetical protein